MDTVFEAFGRFLAEGGTRQAFTLMSDDTAKLVVDLERRNVALLCTRHEHIAVGAADGYARASGQVGVVVIGRGPGLTNCLNALITAQKARTGLLIIIGEAGDGAAAPTRFGKDIAQGALLAALEIFHVPVLSAATAVADLAVAHAVAAGGRPVVVTVPADFFEAAAGSEPSAIRVPDRPLPQAPAAAEIGDVCDLLETSWAAKRPVILAGQGAAAAGAGPDLVELGELIGAIYGTTLRARSLFAGQGRDIGIVGTFASPVASELLATADVVLAFGASLNANTTYGGSLFPGARIVHVDIDPDAPGRYAPAELTVRADARLAARALTAELTRRGHRGAGFAGLDAAARLAAFTPEYQDVSARGALDPRTVMRRLDALLPADRNVVIDPGHHFAFGVPYLTAPGPDCFVAPLEYGAVGSGLGPALGVAVASPDRVTVLSIGDGGLMMTLADLDTAVRYRLPLIVIVSDDGGFGSEVHYLRTHNLPEDLALFDNPPFEAVASALGADSLRIEDLSDLDQVPAKLAAMTGPLLLNCAISREVRGDWVDFFFGVRSDA